MLQITIPEMEVYDSVNNLFITKPKVTLTLEHSLLSISKWESMWCKPFLSSEQKTHNESIEYVKCMTLTQNVDPTVYDRISPTIFKQISDYIESPMTATSISKKTGASPNREIITSEIIYYWMISYGIPMECQKWHLNRLLTLIKVCDVKNQPKQKMSKSEVMAHNAQLNAARRKAMNTKG